MLPVEEERRLLYVAMTQAKDELSLMIPQRFFTHGQHAQGDRHIHASRTRSIPKALLERFEQTSWPTVSNTAPGNAADRSVRVDVAARMRSMWR